MAKKEKRKDLFKNYSNKKFIKNIIFILIFSLILFVYIMNKMGPKGLNLKVGETSPIEIRASKEIVDKEATKNLEQEIINNQEKIYKQNASVQISMKSTISDFFYNIRKYNKEEGLSLEDKIDKISSETNVIISKEDYRNTFLLNDKELNDLNMIVNDVIVQIMSSGVEDDEIKLTNAKKEVEKIFSESDFSDSQKKLGADLINSIIQPNKFYDEESTKAQIENKLELLEPVMIKENQVILSKDEKVSRESIVLLRELGLLEGSNKENYKINIGIIILVILLGSMIYGYIKLFNKNILENNKLLLILLIILTVIFTSDLIYNLSPYVMPIATGAMLISLLVDIRLALIVNVFITLILNLTLKFDTGVMAMYLISGSLGSYVINKNQQRQDLMLTGVLVGIVNIFSIIAFGMIKNLELSDIFIKLLYGFSNGIICGILTVGTLPLWEAVFKVITPLKLMELSNPNQPLLKRLLVEAPGTYHHSIIVGNLSERAAEEIGANALLTRVGSYYHDIGKLARPYLFKENQIGMGNPHDDLTPEMSAKIILNHVTDGIELAKKNKLPKEIIDIISQHHGDTKVMYFYFQAKEKNENVKVEDFQYPGPKPQTKESAIVMMADSSEAAVRSIKKPTRESVEDMISKVIDGKVKEGQFSECEINFQDITKIKNAFVSTFMATFHERIEYPDMEKLEEV